MVWMGGTLDMKSSKEVSSVVEDDWSEGMSLLVEEAAVAVPAGEERRGVSSWQRSLREMSLSVRCWRFWRTVKGDVGCDRVLTADEDRSAGVAVAECRLAGLRWLRCLEEYDSDARGANEFGLLKFVSGI